MDLDFSALDALGAKRREANLSMSINDIDLSVRAYNVLIRHGIRTVRDLTKCTRSEVMQFRNSGKRTFEEIVNKVDALGLSFAPETDAETQEMFNQRQEAAKEREINREMAVRNIPDEYKALYFKIKQRIKGRIVGSELQRVLQEMLVSDPDIMAKALQDTVMLAVVADRIEAEKQKLEERQRKVSAREKEAEARILNTQNAQFKVVREQRKAEDAWQKAEAAKEAVAEASEMLRKALQQMETAEARDRLRAYNLYVADMKDMLKSTQNNSVFLAGAAVLLSGTPITTKEGNLNT